MDGSAEADLAGLGTTPPSHRRMRGPARMPDKGGGTARRRHFLETTTHMAITRAAPSTDAGWAALLSPPHLKSLPAWTRWRDELAVADANVRSRLRFLF